MIKFLVKGQNIETLEHEVIAADQIAFVKIHFVFDNSWKPLHKKDCKVFSKVSVPTSCWAW